MKEKQRGEEEGRREGVREERGREGERVKGCGLSPGGRPSHPPFPPLHRPLPANPSLTGCLSPHNGRFSAEISRYWIPGLEFCPPTMTRQRSMLQGRHTLQVKSSKKPFLLSLASKKGRKSPPPPHLPLFIPSPLFLHTHTHPPYQNQGKAVNSVKLR